MAATAIVALDTMEGFISGFRSGEVSFNPVPGSDSYDAFGLIGNGLGQLTGAQLRWEIDMILDALGIDKETDGEACE